MTNLFPNEIKGILIQKQLNFYLRFCEILLYDKINLRGFFIDENFKKDNIVLIYNYIYPDYWRNNRIKC